MLPPDQHTPERLLGEYLPWLGCWLTAAFIAVASLDTAAPLFATWWRWLPLAASLVVFGLPHGALDHLEIARLSSRSLSSLPVLGLLVGYLLLTGTVVGLWGLAPSVCFAGFIAFTWFHWGQGDLWYHDHRGRIVDGADRIATAAFHGAVPMLGPLAWHPDSVREVYRTTTGLFGDPGLHPNFWPIASHVALGLLGLVTAIYALLHLRRGLETTRPLDLVDPATLLVFFWLVPGIFAVGLYFCIWHGPRHIVRLASLRTSERKVGWTEIGDTFIDAIPLTFVSLLILLAVGRGLVADSPTSETVAWLGWYLVLISGLTVPHTLVVLWMDRDSRLWHPT